MTAEFAIDNAPAVGPPNTGQGREPAIRLHTFSTSLAAWLDSTPYCLPIWGAAVVMGWCVAAVEGGWLGRKGGRAGRSGKRRWPPRRSRA